MALKDLVNIDTAILSYMSSRCMVSSQHKLPSKNEFYYTVTIGELFSQAEIDQAIDSLIAAGKIIEYGPYISDREINVL